MAVMTAAGEEIRSIDFAAMIKEAGLTALVVFALAFSLVGFETLDVPGGLDINTRFADVITASVLAFIGRVGIILLRQNRPWPVLFVAAPFGLILLVILISEFLFGVETGRSWKAAMPFTDILVWWLVAVISGIFAYRAVREIVTHQVETTTTAEQRAAAADRMGARVQRVAIFIGPILLLMAIALPFAPWADRRVLDIAILVMTYIMLGWGLNIVVGLAGLLDLGYVAFYAVGAYSYALLAQHFGFSFWICLPFAGFMSAMTGVILGFPVLRLRGDYLAIVTLGFGEIIRIILLNWFEFTGGPDGLSGIPRPSFFGFDFTRSADEGEIAFHQLFGLSYSPLHRIIFLFYLILAMALIVNLFTLRIRKLPVGRAWEALREDETACRSLGINPRNTKLTAFGIGAMFGGLGGSFFATRQGFISPESFTFIESAVILAIVVLGGMGSQIGVVFAAILLIGLPEIFRDLQQYRMLSFGAAMVLIMIWRPSGLLAHREPTIRLFGKNQPPKEAN